MSFVDQWQEQLKNSLIECAKLVPTVPDVDLKYELMVVGLLWPIRQPIQDFDLEAMKNSVLVLNPDIHIFEVSSKTGQGIPSWVSWLKDQVNTFLEA